MNVVFADACYWIALLHPNDPLHQTSKDVSRSLGDVRIVTTEMVLVEFANSLSGYAKGLRGAVVRTVTSLRESPNVEVVQQTSLQFQNAADFYESRPDKNWGLTDCASFVLMESRSISEALTHDHHFEQAGFTKLL